MGTEPQQIAGGPAQHAGNLFHYLYAATRAMELLQQGSGVLSVRLEGSGTGGVADDALDVVVERANAVEFIQVKWSSSQLLQPAQCWGIVKHLWESAQQHDAASRSVQITLFTNRSVGLNFRRQLDRLRKWRALSRQDLRDVLDNDSLTDATSQALLGALGQITGSSQTDSISALVSSLNIEYGLGPAFSQHYEQLLDAHLRSLGLSPVIKRPQIVELIIEHCLPQQAGHPITLELIIDRLGLTLGPGIAQDIHPPEGYVPWDALGAELDQTIRKLAESGGVIAVLGGPGTGKTVQLGLWAKDKNYPLYACRLERYDEIPMRADQSIFTTEINRLVRFRYHDRISSASGAGIAGIDRGERIRSLRQLLDALGASSSASDPAVLVIDGLDDAVRWNEVDSFLSLLQIPPKRVVLVLSAQGGQFLPEAMRTTSPNVIHVNMPGIPDQITLAVCHSLLDPSVLTALDQGRMTTVDFQQIVESVVRLANGNPMVLSTLCHRLLQEPPEHWNSILADTGHVAFAGIEDYFKKVLGSPSADDLRCLKTLATARLPISAESISRVTSRAIEDLQPSLTGLRYLLSHSSITPRKFSLYHSSLRRYVEQNLFNGGQPAFHLALADLYREEPDSVDLAAERAYHLMEGGRPDVVLELITYEHIDGLFAEFIAPSRLREQVVILAKAASLSGKLTEAVRASLLEPKVEQRIDLMMPAGPGAFGGSNVDAATLVNVLLRTSDLNLQNRAIGLLREVDDPIRRYRIASQVAIGSFRRGAEEQAYAVLAIAKETSLFYETPRDLDDASDKARIEVWTRQPLSNVYKTICSTVWVQEADDEEPVPLSKDKQYDLRGKIVKTFAFEAVRSGQEDELRRLIATSPRIYKVHAILGMVDAQQPPNRDDVQTLLEEASAVFHLDYAAKRDVATFVALVLRQLGDAVELTRRRLRPVPPDLLGSLLPDGRESIDSFKDELLFRMRLGDTPELAFEHLRPGDLRDAATLFYEGLVALYSAKVIAERNGPKSEVTDKLSSAGDAWAQERPYSMAWTPFFGARRELRSHAPHLAALAFGVDNKTGASITNRLWALSGWAIGTLDWESKLEVLLALSAIPSARYWANEHLSQCIDSINGTVRNTEERVSLLLKCSQVASSLGLIERSVEVAREAVQSSKGLPSVNEEPRYYAALGIADALCMRGEGNVSAVKRLARCIDASYEATSRTYAGHTWPWLMNVLSKMDLPLALSLAVELDGEPMDEALPNIITSIHSILLNSSSNLSPAEWVALFWIAHSPSQGGMDPEVLKVAKSVLGRVSPGSTQQQLATWMLTVLRDDGQSIDVSALLSAKDHPDEDVTLESETWVTDAADVIGINAELLRKAVAGHPDTIRTVLSQMIAKTASEKDTDSLITEIAPNLEREQQIRRLLEKFAVNSYSDDLETVRRLHDTEGRGFYRAHLELKIAARQTTQSPKQIIDHIVDALDDLWWSSTAPLVEGLRMLTEMNPEVARQELLDAVAFRKRAFSPFWMADALIHLPESLVTDSKLSEILDVLFDDIEDSLSMLPARPTRAALADGYLPTLHNPKELVRYLLHNRDREIRLRSLQSVGVLSLDGIEELIALFKSREGIDALPTYLQLTAEQQRLAALWVLVELEPIGFIEFTNSDIFVRYLDHNALCETHFLMREYARQILARILENPAANTTTVNSRVVGSGLPRHLSDFDTDYSTGQSPIYPFGILDREFEYYIEKLARLFRVPSVNIIRLLQRIIKLLPSLSPKEQDLDHWIKEQYGPNSRPLIKPNDEIVRHAYRILQGRWYSNRVADATCLDREHTSYFERREFDPWLPALMAHEVEPPCELPGDSQQTGPEWFNEDVLDLEGYIFRDDWMIVHEDFHEGDHVWRVGTAIESCVISQNLAARWLKSEANVEAPHADFPRWIYIREINDNYDAWWNRWEYGTIHEAGKILDASYAVGRLAIDEPWYVQVSRPSPQFAPQLDLEKMPWGFQFRDQQTSTIIWMNRCLGDNEVRILASREWILDTLARNDLLWAFDVRITKERREEARREYGLAEERVWVVRALIDKHGQVTWGAIQRSHQDFERHLRGPR